MIFKNIEGLTDWDINREHLVNRRPGISAMIRLQNEAEWIVPCLDSIARWCDEIVICLQGRQTDGTDEIVKAWCDGHPKAALATHTYPFYSRPNGPGHDEQVRGSVYERAYFYNWCLAKTTCDHVVKWDGDMIALDDAGPILQEATDYRDVVRFSGHDIVGPVEDGLHIGSRKWCPFDPRLFRVTPDTYYQTGSHSEQFSLHKSTEDHLQLDESMYLHFKWAKGMASVTKAWPSDWHQLEHFQQIMKRQQPVAVYEGPVPKCLNL